MTIPTVSVSAPSGAAAKLPAAPAGAIDGLKLAFVAAQLALVLAVVYRFQLESRTFFHMLALACAGFVVHALLPLRYRLPFFAGLSLCTVLLAFGLADGAWLIAFGLVLIGICHLPLRLAYRVLLLLATAALFALWRVERLPSAWSVAIWPILGSMFMFRIALYLHALKHDEKQPTVARTLSYFFMLPNVSFPLFPVVDYLTFRRTYFDRDAYEIYSTGIKWIVRGLIQLVLYRFVYVYLAGDAMELRTLGDLVQFMLATFLLYLRVSGQFHLICGVLCLFGFRLPETHHLYFLSSSFTDFWRRINIYWKDFMMKLVYYPSFFRLKRYGPNAALVGATLIVFAGTWLLHSYQWFWLRGGFPLEPQDGLFWGALGVLVVMGALKEMKRSRPRKLGGKAPVWELSLALRTVGTFTALCILWSLWSADSLMTWLLMWRAVGSTTLNEVLVLLALLAAGLAVAGHAWPTDEAKRTGAQAFSWKQLLPALGLGVLLLLSVRPLYEAAAPRLASVVASLQVSTLNARDAALQHKGYYENLDNKSRLSAHLWSVTAQKPAHWVPLGATPAYKNRPDFLAGELAPNASITFLDQPLTTNAWGMRDRERTQDKAPGTVRIAVLGPSHVMGSGVADDATFTRQLEARLNRPGEAARYEVLNFGVPAYALTQQLALLQDRVFRFQPDVVVFADSPRLSEPVVQHLLHAIERGQAAPSGRLRKLLEETGVMALGNQGLAVPFDPLRALFGMAGIATRMPWTEAEQRLRHVSRELLQATLADMAELVRQHGAVPVFLALDNVSAPPEQPPAMLADAAAAGLVVFDLLDVWRDRPAGELRIAPWDNHPNAAGNALIAERLAQQLQEKALGSGKR